MEDNDLLKVRLEKIAALKAAGVDLYPNDAKPQNTTAQLLDEFGQMESETLAQLPQKFSLAGRLMAVRSFGKAAFVKIQDRKGQMQCYLAKNILSEQDFSLFKKLDIGDIVYVSGKLFRTKTNELTLEAESLRLMAKSIHPLPEKWHGLTDIETRYRQRHLDLISNPAVKEIFIRRSLIIKLMRQFMDRHDFLEVETPMMQPKAGGAVARPFKTHHNALNQDFYLRIAPELYLKRLVTGGLERVYEINRNFRNEGISVRHNPEFTMLEFYMAYADYIDLMDLTEEMLRTLAQDILGDTKIRYAKEGEEGLTIDFGQPFQRLTMVESILKYNPGVTRDDLATLEKATAVAKGLKIELMKSWELGHVITAIFEETVEHMLLQPTFITEYPAAVSPLARRNDQNPDVTDRFEFFIGGRELANGFSELNDAEDQAERFQAQVDQKAAGDDEAMFYDADFVTALEHGLPPTAGQGIGIDRLVMLFTNSHTIRDVILFPALRPQK